ncbi:MAG: TrkH family potassium uptake protein, partial [Firmicutes bacterium]|nr:TrkH family potassium uptake protein [Bacillota bacterium]
ISMAVYLATGTISDPLQALFESVSAFTTTGLSVFPAGHELPGWLMLFRSACQWIGGILLLGFFALLFSGSDILAPSTASFYRLSIQFRASLKRLLMVYGALTAAMFLLLLATGCTARDAICAAFSTVSTGGSIPAGALKNGLSETMVVLFMILTSFSYPLYYYAVKGRTDKIDRSSELNVFMCMIVASCVIVCATLAVNGTYDLRHSIEYGCFQTISNMSTTGYAIADVSSWPSFAQSVLMLLSFAGGCSMSLAGGVRIVRLIVILKIVSRSFAVRIHPKAIISTKVNKKQVPRPIAARMSAYLMTCILFYLIGTFVISFESPDLISCFTMSAALLTSTGPVLAGNIVMSDVGSVSLLLWSLFMIMGRLELYALFIPSSRS